MTNAHPTDSIPAFVLGALDADELFQVGVHLSACEACRAEAETFRSAIDALPYLAPLRHPPPHVKQQLFARIAAGPAPVASARPRRRWPMMLAAGAGALAIAFGAMMADARNQLDQMNDELAQRQQQIERLNGQVDADRQLAGFMVAPQTVVRQLGGPDPRASAAMYMQPGSSNAVLLVKGVPQLPAGKTYQFWLAKPGVQQPANVFEVGQDGMAMLKIVAPVPIDEYAQVMVTVEPSGGSAHPSTEIVLSGGLASAPDSLARQ